MAVFLGHVDAVVPEAVGRCQVHFGVKQELEDGHVPLLAAGQQRVSSGLVPIGGRL